MKSMGLLPVMVSLPFQQPDFPPFSLMGISCLLTIILISFNTDKQEFHYLQAGVSVTGAFWILALPKLDPPPKFGTLVDLTTRSAYIWLSTSDDSVHRLTYLGWKFILGNIEGEWSLLGGKLQLFLGKVFPFGGLLSFISDNYVTPEVSK